MNKISLLKKLLLLFSVVFFASCDKEFNTIGADIVGENYFNLSKDSTVLVAYNKRTGAVQSNNLAVNSFGIINNAPFGKTKAHFVSQLTLSPLDPTLDGTPLIDSVYLYVPYFNKLISTDSDGNRTFKLDSIFRPYTGTAGDVYNHANNKFKVKVYENGYYLRDFDPGSDGNFYNTQNFYSNQKPDIESYKINTVLNDSPNTAQNDEFYFDNSEIKIYKTKDDGSGVYLDADGHDITDPNNISLRVVQNRIAPGMWMDLNKAYFQNKIFGPSAVGNLVNNNVFKQYFKGLYFQVDEIANGQGALSTLNFAKGKITILYRQYVDTDNDPTTPRVNTRKTLVLNLSGNSINLLENDMNAGYNAALSASNTVTGDANLYLKGGDGSLGYVDLFENVDLDGNHIPDKLDELKSSNWLINEAYIRFYVDQDKMATTNFESLRVYLYNATDNIPVADYNLDSSINGANTKLNKTIFGGIIEKKSGKGYICKVRISQFLKNLIKSDDENLKNIKFKFGIAVTENINNPFNAYISTASPSYDAVNFKLLPVSSVMSPLGTVLHGTTADETLHPNAKPRLIIYYTKPD